MNKEEQFDFYWKEIFTGLAYNPIEFNTYRFDQSMSLPSKFNKLYEMFKQLALNNQEVMDYLKEFVETFDFKLETTVKDVLVVWLNEGLLADGVREAINEEVVESRTDHLGQTYLTLKERLDLEREEVILARGEEQTLSKRLDSDKFEVSVQLSEISYNANLKTTIDKTGIRDSTQGINDVILELCKKTKGHKKIIFDGQYKILGTILLPSDVEIDLNGSTFIGGGYNTNDMIKSGVYNGVSIELYNSPSFLDSIERTGVYNGTIKDCGKAFDIVKMNRGCTFNNLYFVNCEQSIKATRCYYASFKSLQYRSSDWIKKDESLNPAFEFITENNVMEISHISTSNRKVGMQVYDVTSGLEINNCSFESCDVGFKELGNEIRNIELNNCYFESCVIGCDVTINNKVSNSFFNTCDVGINTSIGGTFERNNFFRNCVVNIKNSSAPHSGLEILKLPDVIAYDSIPNIEIDSKYQVGAFATVERKSIQIQSSNPQLNNVQNTGTKNVINTFKYVGRNGHLKGEVPFASHSKTTGTTFDIILDTNLTYEPYSIIGYHFKVTDNDGSFDLYGTIFGTKIDKRDDTAKDITIYNNDGLVKLTLSNFNHPTEFYDIEGVIRHL